MRKIYWSLLFIGIGIWILLSNYGVILFKFSRDWPILLIAIGLAEILDVIFSVSKTKKRPHVKSKTNVKEILDSLEKGNISIDEAEKKIKGGLNG